MKSELPKVLHTLAGKPLITHVIDNICTAGIKDIIVVVGYRGEDVIDTIGSHVEYAWQHEQLGTGHAVLQSEEFFQNFKGNILVACGDVPLIKPSAFQKLIDMASGDNVGAVVLTMMLEDPHGYGRIIKDSAGNLERIVEEKDASNDEKAVKEVNTGTYVFDRELLFDGLRCIGNDNAQGEYYLPDVLDYIRQKDLNVLSFPLMNAIEGSGINSKEELKRLEEMIEYE